MDVNTKGKLGGMTRRGFVGKVAAAGAALAAPAFVPNLRSQPPSKKLNVALVGFGPGRCWAAAADSQSENVVAVCDVDQRQMDALLAQMAEKGIDYSGARRFQDFRKMLDAMAGEIDAVVVTTPDHSHFPIAMAAMQSGRHVMVEKPLTHTVWEARELQKAAAHYKVITQMGNQGRTTEGIRLVREWTQAGILGEVREVNATGPWIGGVWFKRPEALPLKEEPVPDGLDWDTWLCGVAHHPYSGYYHPKTWRGWWAFGSATLGDWGAHTLEAPWWALDLGAPSAVSAEVPAPNPVHAPACDAVVTFEFPARGSMPPVTLKWYEGKGMPIPPDCGLETGAEGGRAMFMLGSKAAVMTGGRPDSPKIVPAAKMEELRGSLPPKSIPRVRGGPHKEFFSAVKGEGPMPGSQFSHAGPLTEFLLLGVIAMRTGKRLEWDPVNLRITNDKEMDAMLRNTPRPGWDYRV